MLDCEKIKNTFGIIMLGEYQDWINQQYEK
jgi:hypothetical protein